MKIGGGTDNLGGWLSLFRGQARSLGYPGCHGGQQGVRGVVCATLAGLCASVGTEVFSLREGVALNLRKIPPLPQPLPREGGGGQNHELAGMCACLGRRGAGELIQWVTGMFTKISLCERPSPALTPPAGLCRR